MMKFLQIFVLLCTGTLTHTSALTQPLSLDTCYLMARGNYPMIKKLDLIGKSSAFSLENISKAFLPQLNVTGQATYQSQTVSFSEAPGGLNLPGGINLPNISKDQYKVQADISQLIYGGGNVKNQRAYVIASQAVQQQQIEVALYAVNERINQIYFSILLIEEQLKQNVIRKSDLQGAADKTTAALRFGTAFKSNLDQLNAEIVNANMVTIELTANRTAYLKMLELFIGKPLHEDTLLETPQSYMPTSDIQRPELKLYDFQRLQFDVAEKKLKTDYMPKLSAFAQGAYGRPSLNFISNKFSAWYLVGARLNWNLSSLYTLKNNRHNLDVSRSLIEADRETFLLNANLSLSQQNGDIDKYNQLIARDHRIIELRTSVKKSAMAQLENGVVTTHDYIAQVNAENQSRQTLVLHQIQLLQAQYKARFLTGN